MHLEHRLPSSRHVLQSNLLQELSRQLLRTPTTPTNEEVAIDVKEEQIYRTDGPRKAGGLLGRPIRFAGHFEGRVLLDLVIRMRP